ncbi:hypothetical protein D9757_009563 [Collybiopsis confluens]|uniref:Uncharacterized protein n=1 Tax=Collybiopsis confluens TaxID=2823264 RepID=A0A8H5M2S0_9AGAR|nr:hypothetical protein D9757_009563 [Collybiopsis confluens]
MASELQQHAPLKRRELSFLQALVLKTRTCTTSYGTLGTSSDSAYLDGDAGELPSNLRKEAFSMRCCAQIHEHHAAHHAVPLPWSNDCGDEDAGAESVNIIEGEQMSIVLVVDLRLRCYRQRPKMVFPVPVRTTSNN